MSFRSAKSRRKNDKDGDMGRPTAKVAQLLMEVCDLRRNPRNCKESDRVSRYRTRSYTPMPPARGGGGFKGLRLMPPTPELKRENEV